MPLFGFVISPFDNTLFGKSQTLLIDWVLKLSRGKKALLSFISHDFSLFYLKKT
jgi:hypothetical protein